MKSWLRATICSVVLLSLAPLAHAEESPEIRAAARTTAKSGLEAYNEGDYERAADYFERAEKLMHAPTHLLYLARSQAQLGRLVAAREAYLKLDRETLEANAPKAFVDAQEAARKELDTLEPRIPYVSLVVQGGGDDVSVFRDGHEVPAPLIGVPQPIDPGTYVFEAKGTGLISSKQSLTIDEGAKETVLLTVRPDPNAPKVVATSESTSTTTNGDPNAGKGQRIAGYSLIGVGVVGAGVGTAFLITGFSQIAKSNERFDDFGGCAANPCTEDEQTEIDEILDEDRKGTKKKNIGIASAGVGAAALVVGTVLLVLAPKKQAKSAVLQPWVGANTFGLAGTF